MEDKVFLNRKDLHQVSGGTGVNYDETPLRICPKCGREAVRLVEERGDCGFFKCDSCGYSYYSDL